MLFNYLQRALQHLNSHTPKLSSADLALLIYTPLNLGEVAEASLKEASQQWLTPVQLGFGQLFHFLLLPLTFLALSINLQAVSGKQAGGWQGMLCCPAPLILHSFHRPGFLGGGGALRGCAVFHLFPPIIREAVSLDLALLLLSLQLASLLSAVTCQQCSGRLCLSLVSMSILITLDLAPHTPTHAPPPPLPWCRSALPHSNLLWGFLCTGQGGDVAKYSERQPERDGYRFFL